MQLQSHFKYVDDLSGGQEYFISTQLTFLHCISEHVCYETEQCVVDIATMVSSDECIIAQPRMIVVNRYEDQEMNNIP